LLERCPSLHAVYYPSFLWLNAHLQLVPFMLNCHLQEHYLRPFAWVTELASLDDGEQVALDWVGQVPSVDEVVRTPILMLHHGAGGRSSDLPGQTYVRAALRRGWLVCALNRRGHKPGLPLRRRRWNFFVSSTSRHSLRYTYVLPALTALCSNVIFNDLPSYTIICVCLPACLQGCTEDLRQVIQQLVRSKRPRASLFMLGISAGSGLVARFMGEQGQRRREAQVGSGASSDFLSSFCDAAVGVCPGFDVERCMGNFGAPYSSLLLLLQKAFLVRHAERFGDKASYGGALEATDLQQWLDRMWSVAHEQYRGPGDYYEAHNPMRVTHCIQEPCLFINAEDDPLCVPLNIQQAQVEHRLLQADMNAALVVTKTGSHCCFFELGTGLLHTSNWAERASFEFFDAFLALSPAAAAGD
jgi:predicted alpha/beta-fold hydrolase